MKISLPAQIIVDGMIDIDANSIEEALKIVYGMDYDTFKSGIYKTQYETRIPFTDVSRCHFREYPAKEAST